MGDFVLMLILGLLGLAAGIECLIHFRRERDRFGFWLAFGWDLAMLFILVLGVLGLVYGGEVTYVCLAEAPVPTFT